MRETLAIYDAQSYLCSLKQYHRLLRHLQTSKPALLSQRVIHFEFESLLQSFGASYAFFERIYCVFNARLIRLSFSLEGDLHFSILKDRYVFQKLLNESRAKISIPKCTAAIAAYD